MPKRLKPGSHYCSVVSGWTVSHIPIYQDIIVIDTENKDQCVPLVWALGICYVISLYKIVTSNGVEFAAAL